MSLFTVPISLFLAALLLLTFWIRKKFSYWAERGFDFIKPEFPFGNLKDVGYKVHYSKLSRYYYESYKNKAAAIGLYFFTQPVVFLMNLDVIKSVLVKHFHIFHDRGLYANSKGDPLIANLFSIEGNYLRNKRQSKI